jgi:uncharacterized protein YqgC (DUF456 family)
MEIWLAIVALLLTLIGIAGCILPGLPGPPFNYAAVWLLHLNGYPFSNTSLVVLGIITALVLVLDYTIPVFGARIFGATKTGIRLSMIGMLLGIFLTPLGMIGGLLLGAILGDLMEGKSPFDALKSGFGTLAGTLAAIVVKTIAAIIISFPVWTKIFASYFNVLGQ